MAFYVCYAPKRVRIHDAECMYCQHGTGRGADYKRPRNNFSAIAPVWTGPFSTLTEAREKANSYEAATNGLCPRCLPPPRTTQHAGEQ